MGLDQVKPEICLALDTALEACSVGVAIKDHGSVRTFGRTLILGRGHAEHLMDELARVLEDSGVDYQDLTRIAATIGPGSFTGLRVGLATARSLAMTLDLPLIGASSLFALSLTAQAQGVYGPLAVAIDARRSQIYGQLFLLPETPTSPISSLTEASALSAASFASACADGSASREQRVTFIGNGSQLVLDEHPNLSDPIILESPCPDMQALARWALDQPEPETPPQPLYLRAPDAKPQMSKAIARQPS